MEKNTINKRKIINDPVHGFITVPSEMLYDLIEHPFFQRMRWIKQLGLTSLVYPGATHTRFQHTLGCMHLMSAAVSTLQSKGVVISNEESDAVHAAILMHDLGHGPFSHVLESSLVSNISHEEISFLFMERLNRLFENKLSLAIEIFTDRYSKRFLHQLVSGQLDMDRLDYLKRDSFYTGVSEGVISSDRIIDMLQVHNDQLAVEAKGIYSIENFLISRRLMYWQVYLHKTALVAEKMLVNILRRARRLLEQGIKLSAPYHLEYFLRSKLTLIDFKENEEVLNLFSLLDDNDIMSALKIWRFHKDKILSFLSNSLLNRNLLAIELQEEPFDPERVILLKNYVIQSYNINENEADYIVFTDSISNNTYSVEDEKINILSKNNSVRDISEASDLFNLSVLGKTVKKHLLCYPKELRIKLQHTC